MHLRNSVNSMAEEAKMTPEVEAKETETTKAEVVAETKAGDVKIGDVVSQPEVEKARTVPESVFLEEKRERKELSKQVKELTKLIEDGANKKEVSSDIKAIADEFGLTEGAVEKLIRKVGEQTKSEYDKEIEAKLRPLQEKEKSENVDKTFNDHFEKLMESMPEYKDIASRDVIKSLSLDPKNANKTFSKILEESYGHLVTGRKTLETTQARGGNSDTSIDFDKARKDQTYLSEILANPDTKAKYNEGLLNRLRL